MTLLFNLNIIFLALLHPVYSVGITKQKYFSLWLFIVPFLYSFATQQPFYKLNTFNFLLGVSVTPNCKGFNISCKYIRERYHTKEVIKHFKVSTYMTSLISKMQIQLSRYSNFFCDVLVPIQIKTKLSGFQCFQVILHRLLLLPVVWVFYWQSSSRVL